MTRREKILRLVNLVLNIQELNNGAEDFPYASVETATRKSGTAVYIDESGLKSFCEKDTANKGIYRAWGVNAEEDNKAIDAAIEHLERCLERAKEMNGGQV